MELRLPELHSTMGPLRCNGTIGPYISLFTKVPEMKRMQNYMKSVPKISALVVLEFQNAPIGPLENHSKIAFAFS